MESIQNHQKWQEEITNQEQNSWLEDHGLNKITSAGKTAFKAIGRLCPNISTPIFQFFHNHTTVKHLAFGALGVVALLGISSLIGFGDRFHFIEAIKNASWFKEITSTGMMTVGLTAVAATCLTIKDGSLWSSTKFSIVLAGLQITGAFAVFGVLH